MKQKKVCLLGSFSVGKTSLVKRYVESMFDERYHTTVGVKIDKKQLQVADEKLTLMLWDLAGEDPFHKMNLSYLRGTAGYLVVIDPCRADTLDKALDMHVRAQDHLGGVPVAFAFNKCDIKEQWELAEEQLQRVAELAIPTLHTSALSGQGVEALFETLATAMVSA